MTSNVICSMPLQLAVWDKKYFDMSKPQPPFFLKNNITELTANFIVQNYLSALLFCEHNSIQYSGTGSEPTNHFNRYFVKEFESFGHPSPKNHRLL